MTNKRRRLMVLLIALLLMNTSAAQSEKMLVAVSEDYFPYMYGVANNANGLYVQQIEALFSRLGIEVEFQTLPWKRVLQKGDNGEAAVGGIYKNTRRLKIYDYSQPIFEEKLAIYVRKGSEFPFKSLADLKGKKVGLIYGWSYGDAIDLARHEKLFSVEESNNYSVSFKKLIRGRIDCIIVDQLVASLVIADKQLGDKVEKLAVPVSINNIYLVFPKSYHQKKLMDRLNQVLSNMQKEGSYKQLIEGFFTKNTPVLTPSGYSN